MKYYWTILLLIALRASNTFADKPPDWTNEQGRKVIGGDILYFGFGVGSTPENARIRADGMAVKSLASECGGLLSKDITIPDRYITEEKEAFRAFARSSISFDACDQAKAASGKRREELTSKAWQDEITKFDQLEAATRPSVDASNTSENKQTIQDHPSESAKLGLIPKVSISYEGPTFVSPGVSSVGFGASLESRLSKLFGIELGGEFNYYAGSSNTFNSSYKMTGGQIFVQLPIYLYSSKNDAIYIAPKVATTSQKYRYEYTGYFVTATVNDFVVNQFGAGGVIGYQHGPFGESKFGIDIGLGVVRWFDATNYTGVTQLFFKGGILFFI